MEEILHQLVGSLSRYLQGFIHSRWCRICSINSMITYLKCFSVFLLEEFENPHLLKMKSRGFVELDGNFQEFGVLLTIFFSAVETTTYFLNA